MQAENVIINIFQETLNLIRSVGSKHALKIIKTSNKENNNTDILIINFIVSNICRLLDISRWNLIHSNQRDGVRTYAIGLLCYFVCNNTAFNLNEVCMRFGFNIGNSHKYMKSIERLNDNISHEKKIIEVKNELESILNNYKSEI